LPQTEVQQINNLANSNGESTRERARQQTEDLDERPGRREFEFPPHPGSVTLSPGKTACQTPEPIGFGPGRLWFRAEGAGVRDFSGSGKHDRSPLSVNLGLALLFLLFVCSNLFSQIATGGSFRIE
jgi:hypothetical protein